MYIGTFVDLLRTYADRREPESSMAFVCLWEIIRPLIQRQIRNTSTLGPFAFLVDRRSECEQAIALAIIEEPRRYMMYWEEQSTPPDLERWLSAVIRRQAIDWVRQQPEVRRRANGTYERLVEYVAPEELCAPLLAGDLVDRVDLKLRLEPIMRWIQEHLPRDEADALHNYLFGDIPQDDKVRRALEKIRRQFREPCEGIRHNV
jgi:hypothetical protein